jgi:transcriptional regulator with XRE-family HTH domain
MQGFGERVRQRARELGLNDSALARRVGIETSKFGKYLRDTHEPDYPTLLQICAALDVTPNDLLLASVTDAAPTERQRLLSSIAGTCAAMPDEELRVVAKMVAAAGPSAKDS